MERAGWCRRRCRRGCGRRRRCVQRLLSDNSLLPIPDLSELRALTGRAPHEVGAACTPNRDRAGAPMGNFVRRYWWPIGGSNKLDRSGTLPLRLREENLVLYEGSGRPAGAALRRCRHRPPISAMAISRPVGLCVAIAVYHRGAEQPSNWRCSMISITETHRCHSSRVKATIPVAGQEDTRFFRACRGDTNFEPRWRLTVKP